MATGPDLRIGDSDREAAAALLREHYAAGRLTFEEFNQRLDATFAATTQSQLSSVTRDLPHVRLPAAARPLSTASPGRERSRQYRSAPPRGARLLPAILAMLAVWLLVVDLHLRIFGAGKLVILVAVFAAARSAMRWLFRSGRSGRGGVSRGRRYWG
jgi:Domain of unknown function (DUF1707)